VATTNKGTVKIKYTDKPLKVSNVRTALLKKELRHFITNPMYILNAALGVFFTLTAAVALVIYGGLPLSVFESMPEFARFANPLAITALCFLATTNIISAPSISLEGRNLWIPQSLPIDGVDVLLAKANMHIVVCLPSVLIAGLVSIFVLDMTFPQMLLMLILPSLITVFCALFGVVINLHFPKFDWVNEVVAIKQGMSTIIAMLASMASVAVPFLLYAFLLLQYMTAEAFMLICTVIFAVLSLWMFRYLKTKGKAIFETLG
jgi:ABC-2 type transport system permease protein